MANRDDVDKAAGVVYRINHSVIAHTESPEILGVGELAATSRSRF